MSVPVRRSRMGYVFSSDDRGLKVHIETQGRWVRRSDIEYLKCLIEILSIDPLPDPMTKGDLGISTSSMMCAGDIACEMEMEP